jgi:voltage-gated potassium channel
MGLPMPGLASDERRLRWESVTRWPLLVGAVVFLGAYAWPILNPDLNRTLVDGCRAANIVVWLLFAVDLAVRLVLAERRGPFLRENWPDVLTLAVPMLRPVRALRVVLALNMLARRGGHFARGRVVASVGAAVATIALVAAVAMLDAERDHPQANIKGFGDALWWAAATVTTVGYGDRYPTTAQGRFIAVALMITGIALLGVVTAAIASWFVQRMSEVETAERATEAEVAVLAAEIRALRETIQGWPTAAPSPEHLDPPLRPAKPTQ